MVFHHLCNLSLSPFISMAPGSFWRFCSVSPSSIFYWAGWQEKREEGNWGEEVGQESIKVIIGSAVRFPLHLRQGHALSLVRGPCLPFIFAKLESTDPSHPVLVVWVSFFFSKHPRRLCFLSNWIKFYLIVIQWHFDATSSRIISKRRSWAYEKSELLDHNTSQATTCSITKSKMNRLSP